MTDYLNAVRLQLIVPTLAASAPRRDYQPHRRSPEQGCLIFQLDPAEQDHLTIQLHQIGLSYSADQNYRSADLSYRTYQHSQTDRRSADQNRWTGQNCQTTQNYLTRPSHLDDPTRWVGPRG